MAVKYRTEFYDHANQAWRIDIYDDTYFGTVIELNSSTTPLVLRKDEDGVFQGTSAEIGIEVPVGSTWGLTDLYSQTARDHKVDIYKQNLLHWSGYLIPEEYQDPLISPPFDIMLRAVDGIGTLKEFDFPFAINAGLKTHLAIILECLNLLDLNLGLSVCIGINHEGVTDDILASIYSNCAAFYDDNKPFKCDEVISLILNSYDPLIRLTQFDGYWNITRQSDILSSFIYLYNSSGVYEDSGVNFTTVKLRSYSNFTTGSCYPISFLNREFKGAFKKIVINQDYGKLENIFMPQSDFTSISNYTYDIASRAYRNDIWIDDNSNKPIIRTDYDSLGRGANNISNYSGLFTPTGNFVYVNASAFAVKEGTEDVKFTFKVWLKHATSTSLNDVRIKITCGSYYLNATEGWSLTPGYLTFSIAASSNTNYSDLVAYSDPFPADGNVIISIAIDVDYQLVINAVQITLDTATGLNTDVLVNSDNIKTDGIDVFGDVPADDNASLVYMNGFFLVDSTVSSSWKLTSDINYGSLNSILARSIASSNRRPKQLYSGIIKGSSLLNFHRIIEDESNNNAIFRMRDGEYNVLSGEFNVMLEEILPFVEPTYTIIDEAVYGDNVKTLNTLNDNNDYSVFGGNVGAGKRIYQLTSATSFLGKYVMIDSSNNTEAEKFSMESIITPSLYVYDSSYNVRYSFVYNAISGDLEIKNSSGTVVFKISSTGVATATDDSIALGT